MANGAVKIRGWEKNALFLIIAFLVIAGGVAYAYGTNNPQVFGHSGGEIDVTVDYPVKRGTIKLSDEIKILETEIDNLKKKVSSIEGRGFFLKEVKSGRKAIRVNTGRFEDFLFSTTDLGLSKGSGTFIVQVGPITDVRDRIKGGLTF